ncbi:unnamed protein product [Calypogeia fissa]
MDRWNQNVVTSLRPFFKRTTILCPLDLQSECHLLQKWASSYRTKVCKVDLIMLLRSWNGRKQISALEHINSSKFEVSSSPILFFFSILWSSNHSA